MSFWDNVKRFAQPYSDEEYDEEFDDEEEMDEGGYPEEEEQPAPRSRRRAPSFGSAETADPAPDFGSSPAPSTGAAPTTGFGGVINMNTGSKQEVVLFHAKTFADATKAATELRGRKAVILNMENVDKALTRRVVDFLSGCVFALDGKGQKIANATYLFCPHNMEVSGSLDNLQGEVESYI